MDYCNEYNGDIDEQCKQLRELSESYHYVVCGAEKLNSITMAHKHHLSDAIDRANSIGKVIDKLVKDIKDTI